MHNMFMVSRWNTGQFPLALGVVLWSRHFPKGSTCSGFATMEAPVSQDVSQVCPLRSSPILTPPRPHTCTLSTHHHRPLPHPLLPPPGLSSHHVPCIALCGLWPRPAMRNMTLLFPQDMLKPVALF